jgi:hypothetical protein
VLTVHSCNPILITDSFIKGCRFFCRCTGMHTPLHGPICISLGLANPLLEMCCRPLQLGDHRVSTRCTIHSGSR